MNDQFGECRSDAIARRCRDEALAVRDMLTPSPPPPGPLARFTAATRGLGRLLPRRSNQPLPAGADPVTTTPPTGSVH